ncbi:MAG TPA: zinc ribbon domain-containing protein [Amycolatopsis sp.]|nr:zinc ribbon domain-containing protein [Amycolatopsis sp.]
MQCPQCAHQNPDSYTFCGRCGEPRDGASVLTDTRPVAAAEKHATTTQPGDDEATRYLCAAAYLDSSFAERLVTKVLEEPLRAVVQSPALNLGAVLRHVAAARTRHLSRDAVLVFTIVLFLAGPAVGNFGMLALAIVVAWGAVFAEAYAARWGGAARALRRGEFDAGAAPEPTRPILAEQIALAETYANGNVTAYSGYEPFMGYGSTVHAWSIALDVTTPHHEDEPIEGFTVDELYARLGDALKTLDFPRLGVYERLFIDGADIHQDNRFLTGRPVRPVTSVPEELMARLRRHPEDRARPYLVTEIVGWGGELVFTAFLRVSLTSTNLFVEASYSVLPPMHSTYHVIDGLLHSPTPRQLIRLIGRSLVQVVPMVLVAVPRTARQLFAGVRQSFKASRQRREMQQFGSFDHGALISIREAASEARGKGPGYHRYFQVLDKEMYVKVVEKKVFDTLREFLADKNIDPDELMRRAESIVNNGVIVSGNATVSGGALGGRAATVLGKVGLKEEK